MQAIDHGIVTIKSNELTAKRSESEFLQKHVENTYHPEEDAEQLREQELAILKQEAYAAGYDQAKVELENIHQAQANILLEQHNRLTTEQNQLLAQLHEKIDQETIKINAAMQEACQALIHKIVLSIVQTELSQNIEKLNIGIQNALTLFTQDKLVSVYLGKEAHEKIAPLIRQENRMVYVDPALANYDFYVTMEYSKLDGQLETRVRQAITSLFNP